MRELIELAEAIALTFPDVDDDLARFWCVHPGMTEEEWNLVPPELRFEVEFFAAQIRKLMPADFEFVLLFDDDGAHFWLEDKGGPISTFGEDDIFDYRGELLEILRETNWEQVRAETAEEDGTAN